MNPIIINIGCGLAGVIVGAVGMLVLIANRMAWRLDITKWTMTGTRLDGSTYRKEGLYVGNETYHRVR